MPSELLNADFEQRAVVATEQLPWTPSPQAGVERRMLDRIGGEVARATSVVRYAPASSFPAHAHGLGEEFLVLEGVFSDEQGDYPAGTYVRNPPGSRHAPRTAGGCTILVKLRQMDPGEQRRVVVNTKTVDWEPGEVSGHRRLRLYAATRDNEQVTIERLENEVSLPAARCAAGEEIFVLSGTLSDEHGSYSRGTWIRNPPGFLRRLKAAQGTVSFWAKRGHLKQPRA